MLVLTAVTTDIVRVQRRVSLSVLSSNRVEAFSGSIRSHVYHISVVGTSPLLASVEYSVGPATVVPRLQHRTPKTCSACVTLAWHLLAQLPPLPLPARPLVTIRLLIP